jgi:hypothetical protein
MQGRLAVCVAVSQDGEDWVMVDATPSSRGSLEELMGREDALLALSVYSIFPGEVPPNYEADAGRVLLRPPLNASRRSTDVNGLVTENGADPALSPTAGGSVEFCGRARLGLATGQSAAAALRSWGG